MRSTSVCFLAACGLNACNPFRGQSVLQGAASWVSVLLWHKRFACALRCSFNECVLVLVGRRLIVAPNNGSGVGLTGTTGRSARGRFGGLWRRGGRGRRTWRRRGDDGFGGQTTALMPLINLPLGGGQQLHLE